MVHSLAFPKAFPFTSTRFSFLKLKRNSPFVVAGCFGTQDGDISGSSDGSGNEEGKHDQEFHFEI